MGDGLGLAVQLAGLAQHGHDLFARRMDGLALDAVVAIERLIVGARFDHLGWWADAPVGQHDAAHGELQFAPPGHVVEVAERADHGDARALFGIGQRVGPHLDLDIEQRRAHRRAEQRLVALVIGVGHEGHAGGDQFGPGRLDEDGLAVVAAPERDAVVGAGHLAVLELGLGHRGAIVDVPQHGRLGLVGLAPTQVAQEGALGHPPRTLVDGGVVQRPVDGVAEATEQILEDLLVDGGETLAQLDEVAPRDGDGPLGRVVGWLEAGVVWQRRVALDPVVVLDPSLGGQAVVVPPHGVEDLSAAHALVAGDGVGVGVGEHVTDVQRSADRGGRGVDGVHLIAGLGAVETVGALLVPHRAPARLDAVEGGLGGNRPSGAGGGGGGGRTGLFSRHRGQR